MKQLCLFITLVVLLSARISAQENGEPTSQTLQKVISLKIDRAGNTDAAAVAWHPVQKKYYAAQAGMDAPMMVFDEKGKKIAATGLKTGVDVRGFWYNPAARTLQVTTAGNAGWYEYALDDRGVPENRRKIGIETSQQDLQAVGAYAAGMNSVYFFDHNTASVESRMLTGLPGATKIKLHLGSALKDNISDEAIAKRKSRYNQTTIVYTGIAHAEIGLLNIADKQVELYDGETGLMTQVLKLPPSAPTSASLNFSYSNNIYWLYDKAAKEWDGYKSK